MAWHFSKVELGSQTSKMVGVERGHSEIGGQGIKGEEREREREREKGKERVDLSGLFGCNLREPTTMFSSSWAAKRYVSQVLPHTHIEIHHTLHYVSRLFPRYKKTSMLSCTTRSCQLETMYTGVANTKKIYHYI